MSGQSDLNESIKRWNINNPSLLMFLDYEEGSPRNYLRIKVKKEDRVVLELTGYEGEEFLWSDLVRRTKVFL